MNIKNKRFELTYKTLCGVVIKMTREMGEALDTCITFQKKDGSIVKAFLTEVV